MLLEMVVFRPRIAAESKGFDSRAEGKKVFPNSAVFLTLPVV